jgi:hypothetical protein
MLVHSAMYYRYMTSIVSDRQFDAWAYELRDLQRKHPKEAAACPWAAEFSGWDGTTGFDLPDSAPWIGHAVKRLLTEEERK